LDAGFNVRLNSEASVLDRLVDHFDFLELAEKAHLFCDVSVACLAVQAVHQRLETEPHLRVIEENQFSRERQISENIQREGNTAVDRARAIAGLILLQLDIHPDPAMEDDLDYFRQVLGIKRLPNGTWPPVEEKMRLSRPVLQRHLDILRLPTDLVYLAKLYNLPEGRLREIVAAPVEHRRAMVLLAVEEDLTARELRQEAEARTEKAPRPRPAAAASAHKKAASRLRSFMKLANRREFSGDFERVAAEYSAVTEDAAELIAAAEQLEAQAHWLRVMFNRRQ